MSSQRIAGAFVCPNCRQEYGDPLYHGPRGHAPQNVCLECWADEWSIMEARMYNGGDWSVLDAAFWLVCCGLTRQEAARLLGMRRNEVQRWLLRLRRNPHLIPDWLRNKAGAE